MEFIQVAESSHVHRAYFFDGTPECLKQLQNAFPGSNKYTVDSTDPETGLLVLRCVTGGGDYGDHATIDYIRPRTWIVPRSWGLSAWYFSEEEFKHQMVVIKW